MKRCYRIELIDDSKGGPPISVTACGPDGEDIDDDPAWKVEDDANIETLMKMFCGHPKRLAWLLVLAMNDEAPVVCQDYH